MPSPPGCAEARCSTTTRQCEYLALDKDGDGERAASCTAAVSVAPGGDCNDTPGSGVSINSTAAEVCDSENVDENCSGVANEGCSCTAVGDRKDCCSGRGFQLCEAGPGGTLALSTCSVPSAIEVCNGVDDDCDGTVDDAVAFSLDGGPVEIDGGVVLASGGCSVGVGACSNTSTARCTGGTLTCGVDPRAPTAEACNGLDDDCDGTVDENPGALCGATGQICTGGTCLCPTGQTLCGTSCQTLGGACTVGVGACLRSGTRACAGGAATCNAVAGTPSAEVCDNVDNDCNGTVDENVKVGCYPDEDNDLYASSTSLSQQCIATGRAAAGNCPVGFVAPGSSQGADCSPANGAAYRLKGIQPDSDSDGRCAAGVSNACVGTTAPGGSRFSENCLGSDCNDANSAVYQLLNVRRDGDNDGFCSGGLLSQCTGAGAQPGYRTSCSGDDCRDSNPLATTTCFISSRFNTSYTSKGCGIGLAPSEVVSVFTVNSCPAGFSATGPRTEVNAPAQCSPNGTSSVTATCGGIIFGIVECRIVADCTAN